MYESRHQKPLTRKQFTRRVMAHGLVVITILLLSVILGMAGYMYFEQMPAIDAFQNTAMLLGGMGQVNAPQTNVGKLFTGLFALYAGLVFIVAAALVFAPVLHRLLHRFHWDSDQS